MPRTTMSDEATTRQASPVSNQPRLVVVWPSGHMAQDIAPFGTLIIGRVKDCDICVDHTSVSRQHVRIHAGKTFAVEDLGSSNGTWLAGRRLPPNVVTPWPGGTLLQVGSANLVLQLPEGRDVAATDEASAQPATSTKMQAAQRLLAVVAPARISVILEGETGVGKQVLAERIHAESPRATAPFVSINCAALPDALLESELFGFEKGTFTGATQSKAGLLETAEGGTVLLDEVGEMPLGTQAKLLRVIENREVQRLGATKPRPLDVRFLAATNRRLAADVAAGKFRADLYYRLNGVTITTPPLRERRDEIPSLVQLFLTRACAEMGCAVPRVTHATARVLEEYDWPGNVRELKNAVERAALMAQGGPLEADHFGLSSEPSASPRPEPGGVVPPAPAAAVPRSTDLRAAVGEMEKQRILAALNETGGNQTRAAKLLGISRRSLLDRLDAYDLPRPQKGGRGV